MTYHCTACGRAIFHADDILRRVTLSQLGDHKAECFAIKKAISPETLTRYDVSLHEGWYCCRFIMMRMTYDKFGTGDELLVYCDSVTTEPKVQPHRGAIRLTNDDHDVAINAHPDKLVVVKHGAIWCPPCRHMDAVITKLVERDALPNVTFFDLDIDEQPEIASRFNAGSVPYFVFYKNGQVVHTRVGAMPEKALVGLVNRLAQPAAA